MAVRRPLTSGLASIDLWGQGSTLLFASALYFFLPF